MRSGGARPHDVAHADQGEQVVELRRGVTNPDTASQPARYELEPGQSGDRAEVSVQEPGHVAYHEVRV